MNEAIAQFGVTLRHLRRQLGLSQSALALTLQTTQRHVSFLENGRSKPTQTMIGRIATGLSLSAGQRAALFEASGFRNPYPARDFASEEVCEALDVISNRILAHWPFPAFVMDQAWTVLRMNAKADRMLMPFQPSPGTPLNMLELFLSESFRALIENWEETSAALYFRMQSAAVHSRTVARALETAKARGDFDHIGPMLTGQTQVPIFVPAILRWPEGPVLRLTSLLGQLASVHDALVEGFEIELMVPIDADSEKVLQAL